MTLEDILALPDEQMDGLILNGQSLVFRAGSAEVLGQFKISGTYLVIELAQIDGGGEGVLPTLWQLAERYALKRRLEAVEWIVYAVACSKPNPKLRRILELRGFRVRELAEYGSAYYFLQTLPSTQPYTLYPLPKTR